MQPAPNYKYRPSLIEENPALLLWLLLLGAYFVPSVPTLAETPRRP